MCSTRTNTGTPRRCPVRVPSATALQRKVHGCENFQKARRKNWVGSKYVSLHGPAFSFAGGITYKNIVEVMSSYASTKSLPFLWRVSCGRLRATFMFWCLVKHEACGAPIFKNESDKIWVGSRLLTWIDAFLARRTLPPHCLAGRYYIST